MVTGNNKFVPRADAATCREMAPLVARFNDPELSEAEQVRLSTHLTRCAPCRKLLDHYRQHDCALRSFSPIALAPRVRSAIYAELAAQAPPYRLGVLTTVATTALAVMFVTSVVAFRTLGTDAPLWGRQDLQSDALTQSVASTRFVTRAMTTVAPQASVSATLLGAGGASTAQVPPTTLMSGTVAVLSPAERRLVLHVAGSENEESLWIVPSTVIHFIDGRVAELADLVAGTPVRVLCDRDDRGLIATAIVVLK